MRCLLDTYVVSDARLKRAAPMAWLRDQAVGDLTLSVITMLKLEQGVRRKERKDPGGATSLRLWLDEDVRPIVGGRVLPAAEQTAIPAATLPVPDPLPEMDVLIAATAIVNDLTLVMRNTTDLQHRGVRLLCPWEV